MESGAGGDQQVEFARAVDGSRPTREIIDLAALQEALAEAENEIASLRTALEANRVIAVALGILIERYGISQDTAFAYLKRLSQDNNRKLRDLAAELVDTGKLSDDGEVSWPDGP
ncbi:ANTAR domain-containing protein [Microlunatus elymi]|uniref:ANTAR domain-containing protein n=1 Tax=Microlunatus elymi TaxID=2596828 RepID=UPI00143DB7ED|nr:ANTAR domain-containing protein [Microlunatus elymi]